MYKKLIYLLIAGFVLVSFTGNVFAQSDNDSHTLTISFPSIELLDIVEGTGGSTAITLTVDDATNPGDQFFNSNPSNSALYLRYTVLTTANKKITVQLTGDAVPANTDLTVVATAPSGGAGSQGTPQAAVTLDDQNAHDLITAIGSCWTGTGTTSGANLTYELALEGGATADDLVEANTSSTITYTIAD